MTDEKPKKQSRKKKGVLPKEPRLYYVRSPISDFTSAGNPVLKRQKVDCITLKIIKVWIFRFVMRGLDAEDFGIEIEGSEYVAWFKYESEADGAEDLFREIKNYGCPSHKNWNV